MSASSAWVRGRSPAGCAASSDTSRIASAHSSARTRSSPWAPGAAPPSRAPLGAGPPPPGAPRGGAVTPLVKDKRRRAPQGGRPPAPGGAPADVDQRARLFEPGLAAGQLLLDRLGGRQERG